MRPRPRSDSSDPALGSRALADVFQEIGVSARWARHWNGAFAWTAFRLRQEVRVGGGRGDGYAATRLTATAAVVDEVAADEATVCRTLSALNRLSVGEALVWDADRRCVLSHTGILLDGAGYEENVRDLSSFAVLALAFAELGAEVLARLLHARVAVWRHPRFGFREEPDQVLGVKDAVFAPCGERPSAYTDADEFEEVARTLSDGPYFSAGGGAEGIAVEVAFGSEDTALIHVQTDRPHPYLGNGMTVATRFRAPGALHGSCGQLATYLNLLEFRGDPPCSPLGAWCVDDTDDTDVVTHVCFYPNALHRRGLAARAVSCAIRRATWVADVLVPHQSLSPRRAADIVAERLRKLEA